MLSLFRHATRCSVSAARPAFVVRYSTKPVEASSSGYDPSVMEETQALLEKQAESQPSRDFSGGGNISGFNRTRESGKWKPFPRDGFVRPHDFTYKARFNAPSAYHTRRPQLGPPPSISRYNDVFHQLDIDPLDLTMEINVMSYFVSDMGKVYGRNFTGLTSKSQRRLGKAIRRAKMMGVIPILYKSPYYYRTKNSK